MTAATELVAYKYKIENLSFLIKICKFTIKDILSNEIFILLKNKFVVSRNH